MKKVIFTVLSIAVFAGLQYLFWQLVFAIAGDLFFTFMPSSVLFFIGMFFATSLSLLISYLASGPVALIGMSTVGLSVSRFGTVVIAIITMIILGGNGLPLDEIMPYCIYLPYALFAINTTRSAIASAINLAEFEKERKAI